MICSLMCSVFEMSCVCEGGGSCGVCFGIHGGKADPLGLFRGSCFASSCFMLCSFLLT